MIGLDGSRKVVPVITDRGPLKAVYLASSTLRSALAKKVLNVEVEALGRCELNERGTAKLDGYIFARQEW
jgi:hypothetical protein